MNSHLLSVAQMGLILALAFPVCFYTVQAGTGWLVWSIVAASILAAITIALVARWSQSS